MSTDHTSGSSFDHPADFAIQPEPMVGTDALPVVDEAISAASGSISIEPDSLAARQAEAGQTENFESTPGSVVESPADTDAIEFRVVRAGAPIRRLRLTGSRYTFGSAEGCSIRLTDHALRPMHAVLIRDQTRILVRAYSVPIEVNGVRKTEAILAAGDRVRLGAYQFELLASASLSNPLDTDPAFQNVPRSIFDSPFDPGADTLNSSSVDATSPFESPRTADRIGRPGSSELPATEDVIWRDRLRREIDQWRDRQSECDRRESRIDERESDLRSRESELWTRAENLYRRETRLQSQETSAFQLYEDYGQRQQELIHLRDQAQARQEEFHQRESEFKRQEFEYRRKLQEATEQLVQSQQQAESATQAVHRMREQFESLNDQIEHLSGQQHNLETQELRQQEELRHSLETARDQAIDAQAESDARRHEAEARLEAMSAQIEDLRSTQGEELQTQLAKLAESEQVAEQLRQQVEELQRTVSEATEETSQLRMDYEGACESVRQLESLVEQSQNRGDSDRESWATEADELRLAVDQLSVDLARANSELSELREANDATSERLNEAQQERDAALAEAETRPTHDAFQSLRDELDAAHEQLASVKEQYEETLQRLADAEADRQAEGGVSDSVSPLAGPAQANAFPEHALPLATSSNSDETTADGVHEPTNTDESDEGGESDDDAWPTYQATGAMPLITPPVENDEGDGINSDPESVALGDMQETPWLETNSEREADFKTETPATETDDQSAAEAEPTAAWNDAPNHEVDPHDSQGASTTNWNETPAWQNTESTSETDDQLDWTNQESGSPEATSIWNDSTERTEPESTPAWAGEDNEDGEIVQGSLASQLIQDLKNEQEPPTNTYLMPDDPASTETPEAAWREEDPSSESWDREYLQEASGSDWTSRDDDDRLENLADSGEPSDVAEEFSHESHAPGSQENEAHSSPGTVTETSVAEPEDDSIEAYMNRLLNRARPGSDSAPEDTVAVTDTNPLSASLTDSDPTEGLAEHMPEPIMDPDAPLVPRSQAPEKSSDLDAMRELANASARSAISRSVRIQNRNIQIQGVVNLACAAGALGCCVACFYLLSGFLQYLAIAMTIIIAAICIREAMGQFGEAARKLQAAKSGELNEDDFEPEDANEPPTNHDVHSIDE